MGGQVRRIRDFDNFIVEKGVFVERYKVIAWRKVVDVQLTEQI